MGRTDLSFSACWIVDLDGVAGKHDIRMVVNASGKAALRQKFPPLATTFLTQGRLTYSCSSYLQYLETTQ